ncbi:hypothetical protein BDR05DRAFT_988494 [Suillus weaverae]|nr:hypothetical protein BDR05DRAFT_988494 [Suillus weaverae]
MIQETGRAGIKKSQRDPEAHFGTLQTTQSECAVLVTTLRLCHHSAAKLWQKLGTSSVMKRPQKGLVGSDNCCRKAAIPEHSLASQPKPHPAPPCVVTVTAICIRGNAYYLIYKKKSEWTYYMGRWGGSSVHTYLGQDLPGCLTSNASTAWLEKHKKRLTPGGHRSGYTYAETCMTKYLTESSSSSEFTELPGWLARQKIGPHAEETRSDAQSLQSGEFVDLGVESER